MATDKKREALSVTRLINEVLVNQLSIPLRQIVNDTSFQKYTGSKRPDLLISEVEFNGSNEEQYVKNLIAYAEVKDDCKIGDANWQDAINQGVIKSKKLGLPYFIVTNCKASIFYNASTLKKITLNNNPIGEFQTIDILRLIKNRLKDNCELSDISTGVDLESRISEAIFNKKLWELKIIYRGINFKDNSQKIDFTIGFISLEYFEEKVIEENKKDYSLVYWSECNDEVAEKVVANLSSYITRLETYTDFKEFMKLMESVRTAITGIEGNPPLVSKEDVKNIYDVIDSMKPLHGTGFDLFGAVYEMFASSKEKKDFGEYFTRRHYTHILSKLRLKDETYFNSNRKFKFLDLASGTGGFLTEGFKVLKKNYQKSNTLTDEAKTFLARECFYGIDVREENISRTKLNMFLVGDGHTNMYVRDTLKYKFRKHCKFDYIVTNPPYGEGTIYAESTYVKSKRTEIAFLFKIIKLLKDGGKACVIIPDGVLENPSLSNLRKEFLEKCELEAIISLPKFAFAPYTKEKTYAVFFTKKNERSNQIQDKAIWMYIIDNDGLANSDNRYLTKLRDDNGRWLHDEISGWANATGKEMSGLLEERWLKFDDSATEGTSWVNEKGQEVKLRKGGYIEISEINEKTYFTLLPEFYLRPFEPNYITLDQLKDEVAKIENLLKEISI